LIPKVPGYFCSGRTLVFCDFCPLLFFFVVCARLFTKSNHFLRPFGVGKERSPHFLILSLLVVVTSLCPPFVSYSTFSRPINFYLLGRHQLWRVTSARPVRKAFQPLFSTPPVSWPDLTVLFRWGGCNTYCPFPYLQPLMRPLFLLLFLGLPCSPPSPPSRLDKGCARFPGRALAFVGPRPCGHFAPG